MKAECWIQLLLKELRKKQGNGKGLISSVYRSVII